MSVLENSMQNTWHNFLFIDLKNSIIQPQTMIKILIADDHRLIRETWSVILGRDKRFNVLAGCANSTEAVRSSRKLRPDVLLLDINMGPYNGIEAAKRIRKVSPDTGIIAVTMSNQPAHAKKLLGLGAKGYVTKNSSPEEMTDAIVAVSKGQIFICAEMAELLAESSKENGNISGVHRLTAREIQVADLIKAGHSSREISQMLDICLKTVETHRHNLLKKLGVKNAVSLVHALNDNVSLN
jgi:DNA-binding NarL/FixJ family response regulator